MSENKDLAERFRAFVMAWNQRRDAGDLIYSYGTMEGAEGARREAIHAIAADDLVRAARALDAMPECTCTGASQDAGGGYFEHLLEPDPECPEHFPQNALGGVGVDDIARVIDPLDWAISDAPQYAHLPEGARDGLRRNSREAAERVQALLAHRAETGAAMADSVGLPASDDVARAVQEYMAHRPRVAVGVRYWCGVCEISMDGRHVAMMHAMERALAVHESRPKA